MKGLLKTLKGKIMVAAAGVVVVATVVAGIVSLLSREESYRSIAVDGLQGSTIITSETVGEKEAYKGMYLNSGDDVQVQSDANLTLKIDADKHLYAGEKTHFKVEYADGEKSNKKVIHLMEGSTLNRLENALKDGESYTVETPNATMAVRGTVFRVTVDRDEDGLIYTLVEVFDGKVQVDLKQENGDYNGVSDTFEPGESVLIRGNTEFAEFVVGEDGTYKQEIAYKEIPQDVAKVLVQYIDDGEEICIGKELLMDYTELAEHKMETITGKEATCTEDGYKEVWCIVCNEVTETVKVPATGHTLADWEIAKDPTCLEAGSRQRICSVCKTYFEEEEIAALGHIKGEYQVTKEADCTHTGTQTATCTRCGAVVDEVEIAATGHTLGGWTTVRTATCTSGGLNQIKCTVCGEVAQTSTTAALGHSYGAPEVVDATCTVDGSSTEICSTCGDTQTTVLKAPGHKLSADMTEHKLNWDASGQTPTGAICIQACTVCDETVETESTITVDEYGALFCDNCGMNIPY